MLNHLVGLLVRVFNAQVTGAKPLQVHYAETYGQADAMVDLVPAMLAAFLESDRSFQRSLNDKAKRSS
jgi:hypothetical protein